ncbi:hypothetical protein MYX76_02510 [Desulfobacterota bacterium AH_259_B03_O07]|nr:hypothetical protein [Desulfobacterota bacterium AH_259_B03_O07]
MSKRGGRKIKDLVDLLEDPENSTYVGGDYEDIMEMLEKEMSASDDEVQDDLEA